MRGEVRDTFSSLISSANDRILTTDDHDVLPQENCVTTAEDWHTLVQV